MGIFKKIVTNISADDKEKERIKEGEQIIKSRMGTKMNANSSFFLELNEIGVSTVKLWPTWNKINKTIKSELYNTSIQPEDISFRIDQLVLDNKSQENIKIEEEYEQRLIDYGVKDFDFTCTVYPEKHMLNRYRRKNGGKVNIDGYCFLHKDKIIIKKFGFKEKKFMGNQIIHYSDISAISFKNKNDVSIINSIQISLLGSDSINIYDITEEDFKNINTLWLNYKNNLEESKKVVKESEHSNVDELMKYAELYEKGLLTKEEFEAMKKKLL